MTFWLQIPPFFMLSEGKHENTMIPSQQMVNNTGTCRLIFVFKNKLAKNVA